MLQKDKELQYLRHRVLYLEAEISHISIAEEVPATPCSIASMRHRTAVPRRARRRCWQCDHLVAAHFWILRLSFVPPG